MARRNSATPSTNANASATTPNGGTPVTESTAAAESTESTAKAAKAAKTDRNHTFKGMTTTLYRDGDTVVALASVATRLYGASPAAALVKHVSDQYFSGETLTRTMDRLTIVNSAGNLEVRLNDHVSHFIACERDDLPQDSTSWAILGDTQPAWVAAPATVTTTDDLDALIK